MAKANGETKKFKIGDTVKCGSMARGYYTEKKGTVVAVIKAGEDPVPRMEKLGAKHILRCSMESAPRSEVSYLVAVEIGGENAKPALYWPRTKNLS